MALKLFRTQSNAPIIEALHDAIVAGARRPDLYLRLGAPDTPFGRAECVMLHALIVVRRLYALPAPAPALAQDVVDRMFADFDRAFRQIGIGDMGVPKKMKALGSDWLGRIEAYAGPLDRRDEDALAAALARNVIGAPENPEQGLPLAQHILGCEAALRAGSEADVVAGHFNLPALV